MEEPRFQIIYLDAPTRQWTPYRCRVSGAPLFDLEGGDKKCYWLTSRGHATVAKLVGESGEVVVWERGVDGRARRTLYRRNECEST